MPGNTYNITQIKSKSPRKKKKLIISEITHAEFKLILITTEIRVLGMEEKFIQKTRDKQWILFAEKNKIYQ